MLIHFLQGEDGPKPYICIYTCGYVDGHAPSSSPVVPDASSPIGAPSGLWGWGFVFIG